MIKIVAAGYFIKIFISPKKTKVLMSPKPPEQKKRERRFGRFKPHKNLRIIYVCERGATVSSGIVPLFGHFFRKCVH